MFERFKESARRVAQFAAWLPQDGEEVTLDHLAAALPFARSTMPDPPRRKSISPFSPESKKAWEFALRVALRRGDNYIGVEHIEAAIEEVRNR